MLEILKGQKGSESSETWSWCLLRKQPPVWRPVAGVSRPGGGGQETKSEACARMGRCTGTPEGERGNRMPQTEMAGILAVSVLYCSVTKTVTDLEDFTNTHSRPQSLWVRGLGSFPRALCFRVSPGCGSCTGCGIIRGLTGVRSTPELPLSVGRIRFLSAV